MLPINFRSTDTNCSKSRGASKGPVAYNDLSLGLSAADYIATYSGTDVLINGVSFFSLVGITELDLTFDVAGNPLVAYLTSSGVSMYWYDPVPGMFVHKLVHASGERPFCYLDLRLPALTNLSDNVVCYERSGGVYAVIRSDRYTIEYDLGITLTAGQHLEKVGMADNELRVILEASGT